MQITINNNKYRYKDNQWQFFIDDGDGDGGLLINNHWYTVINKDSIKYLNNFVREKKLKRICKK